MITNLEEVKRITKTIAYTKVQENKVLPFLAIHPFISDMYWYEKVFKEKSSDIQKYSFKNPEIFDEWHSVFSERIDAAKDVDNVYMYWQKAYKLTFIKFCKQYLSQKDFGRLLADAWITEENPNMDVNVSRKEALRMFKSANKKYLMTSEEYDYYARLPESVSLYRGVSEGREKYGLSWTDYIDVAKWFMNRFKTADDKVKLLTCTTSKNNIIAYFNGRSEKELVLDVFKVKDSIKEIRC